LLTKLHSDIQYTLFNVIRFFIHKKEYLKQVLQLLKWNVYIITT